MLISLYMLLKILIVDELIVGWRSSKEALELISTKYKKKILFTEYGYESIDYPQ